MSEAEKQTKKSRIIATLKALAGVPVALLFEACEEMTLVCGCRGDVGECPKCVIPYVIYRNRAEIEKAMKRVAR